MTTVTMDYLPSEYCFDMGIHFLIPCRDDRNYDTIVPANILDIPMGMNLEM